MDEEWSVIPEFPNYLISPSGEIFNRKYDMFMRSRPNNFGHFKIALTDDKTGERYDRSVVKLVAEAFVDRPDELCNQIVVLDGNFANVHASNLMWRPKAFAWKYTRQLKQQQPLPYRNLRVRNIDTNARYPSIVDCGMTEGLLFKEIWRSTYEGTQVYPYGHKYEII